MDEYYEYSSNQYRDYGRKVVVVPRRGTYGPNRTCVAKEWSIPPAFGYSATSKPSKGDFLFDKREMDRRKRVFRYKWYSTEGKIKKSLKDGLLLFKRKCSKICHG